MAVELWYERWPNSRAEQDVLIELYSSLYHQRERFVLAADFQVGRTHEVDLVVMKPTALFIAEVKGAQGKIVGSVDRPWREIVAGEARPIKATGSNPVKQVQYNYWYFKSWLEEHQGEICAGEERERMPRFSRMDSAVVIYPDLDPASELNLTGSPVKVMGLPCFRDLVMMRSHPDLSLSDREIDRIVRMLRLEKLEFRPRAEVDRDITGRISGWRPVPFVMLVARGHSFSIPVFSIERERVTVGRASDNMLVIHHPAVSRHHAEILRDRGRWVVRDLGSRAGTGVIFDGDPQGRPNVIGREQQLGDTHALKNNTIVAFGPADYTFLLYEAET
jgi:hypothetical protein